MPQRAEPPRTSRYACLGLAGIVVLGAILFLAGVTWGLPSRRIDGYLFGGRPPWPGTKIAELAKADRRDDARRGADVDVNPIGPTTRPVLLNDTDEKRAAVVLRYRLYTNQPDEMVTMMALASMRPAQRDFDPRLYQYGGLFVYPIGILLKVSAAARWVTLRSDLSYYLDHPEAFGRFYVVARCYVVAFGLAGVPAAFWIARRLAASLGAGDEATGRVPPASEPCGSPPHAVPQESTAETAAARARRLSSGNGRCASAGVLAALLYVLLPVVINMAHEAKPHLPGAVLMLFAVLAAVHYVERGTRRSAVTAGILCGASFGMVLSCLPVFAVIPLMTLLRRMPWRRRAAHTLAASAVGGVAYFVANPYVLVNLFANRDLLRSNLGNTLAMFPRGGLAEGLRRAAVLVAEGTSPLTAAIGLLGVVFLGVLVLVARDGPAQASDRPPASRAAPLWLLLAPAAIVFVQFAVAAAGKPGEYGRFAIFPDIVLAIIAAVLISCLRAGAPFVRILFALVLLLTVAPRSYSYVRHFVVDARGGTRLAAAERLADMKARLGPLTIATLAEPAPYCMPPVDLFGNRLYLLPRAATPRSLTPMPDVLLAVADEPGTAVTGAWSVDYKAESPGRGASGLAPARISWADKPFVLLVRRDLLARETLAGHAR